MHAYYAYSFLIKCIYIYRQYRQYRHLRRYFPYLHISRCTNRSKTAKYKPVSKKAPEEQLIEAMRDAKITPCSCIVRLT